MNIPFDDITAAVLNGGKGKRLGGIDKLMLEVDGRTILSRTLQVLQPLFKRIIIAGNGNLEQPTEDIALVSDRFPGAGPLAGIDAALSESETPYLFVFAGDMPWLSADIIMRQVKFIHDNPCDIVVPRIGIMIEPLHSIFSKSMLPIIEEILRTGKEHSVRSLFSRAEIRYFDVVLSEYDPRSFGNINTPGDLNEAAQG
jgi:molybdopterin-guanine dinucleotide biosynthesis protein A